MIIVRLLCTSILLLYKILFYKYYNHNIHNLAQKEDCLNIQIKFHSAKGIYTASIHLYILQIIINFINILESVFLYDCNWNWCHFILFLHNNVILIL